MIEKVVGKNNTWKEIYSEQMFSVNNSSDIIKGLNRNIESLQKKYGASYYPNVMTTMYPVVNMVIFKGHTHSEVWFGFGLFGEQDAPVFRTSSRELIEYFEHYWGIIHDDSQSWEKINRCDIEGSWISVDYNKESGNIIDCAAITIYFSDRDIKIKGIIFIWESNQFRYARDFESTSSHFNNARAILDFTFKGKTKQQTRRNGCGEYRFKNTKEAGIVKFFGGSVFNEDGHSSRIFGRRVHGEAAKIVADQEKSVISTMLTTMQIAKIHTDDTINPLQGQGFS